MNNLKNKILNKLKLYALGSLRASEASAAIQEKDLDCFVGFCPPRNDAKRESFFSLFPLSFSLSPAFTLAEVLITLGIIGVVAAMTIPTLINNYQKTQYVTGLKKAYTQFNQVLLQMAVDNGTLDSIADDFGSDTTATAQKIASYYKVVKTCGTPAGDECFAQFDNNYDGSANSNTSWASDVNTKYKFVTADGMSFAIESYGDNCKTNRGVPAAPEAPTQAVCGRVLIDVNGKSKPNFRGRDVFYYLITSNKNPVIYPNGGFYNSSDGTTGSLTDGGNYYWNYKSSPNQCSNSSKNSYFCTGRIMEKGWVMDY